MNKGWLLLGYFICAITSAITAILVYRGILIMADEYIKKKDIEQKVTAITGEWKDGPEFWIPIEAVLGNIDLLPSADVAPVRHGHWVVIDAEEPRRYGCSECKRLSWNMENYCGNCGARMDGGNDE